MLIFHITIAVLSVMFASLLLVRPSQAKQYINYTFIAATLLSGTYLIVTEHVNILHTCLSGLVYISVVSVLSIIAGRRLAHLQPAPTQR